MFDFGEKIDGDTAQMRREIEELKEVIRRLSSESVKEQAAGRDQNQNRRARYGQRVACYFCGGPHLLRHCQKHWEDQSSRRNKESHSFGWVPEEKNVIGAVARGTVSRKCWSCGKHGHIKKECAKSQVCWRCGKHGHIRKECTKSRVCWNCGLHGHIKRECTRQVVCWSCEETGHTGRNCGKDEKSVGKITEGINEERNLVAGVVKDRVCKGVVDDNNEVPECRKVDDYEGVVDDNNEVQECRKVEDFEGVVDDINEVPECSKGEGCEEVVFDNRGVPGCRVEDFYYLQHSRKILRLAAKARTMYGRVVEDFEIGGKSEDDEW